MASRKPPEKPEESGWNAPPVASDPDAPPMELEELDFSEQSPPDPNTEDEPPPPPIRSLPKPSFAPPRASAEPETIRFGDPLADVPSSGSEVPASPQTPPPPPKSETQQMLDIMFRLVQGQAPMPSTIGLSFEQCAQQLISVFDEPQRNAIRDAAVTHTQGSVANWLLALVNINLDRGTLGEIAYNPDWDRQIRATQQVGTALYTPPASSNCEYCGHQFRPPLGGNVRQRFCCNVCGKKAAGYSDEPLPHGPECTTEAGKLLHQAMSAAVPAKAA
ncbi:MAG TPA: hypothetical protein VFS12_16960 [Terriglobia bacterium]|nr:hypothetical protein [Terriglobia bacterium]